MPAMPTDQEIIHAIDRVSQERTERVRQMLIEMGRFDILEEFDHNMRELRLGITTARNCWHSISEKQRAILKMMGNGFEIRRAYRTPIYDAYKAGKIILGVCRLPTLRALSGHELIHVAGGALDPEAQFVLTERGQFVLKYGEPK